MDFSGKRALVTGGAGSIGKAVAEGIIKGGGEAIIADINLEAAQAVKAALGSKAHACVLDLSNAESVRQTIAQLIADFKRIDILVNCGGIVSTKPFEEVTQADWDRTININLTGTFATISALFTHMKENGGGSIVNVSSVAAKVGGGLLGTAAYASSKAGVNGLTKAVAREGGPFNIRCNAVCPAYTVTPMTKDLTNNPEKKANTLRMIPLGRGAEPQEIANMILFFASDLASFINGEIGDADGGLTRDG